MNTSKRFSLSRYALSAILTLIPVCMFAGNNSMIAMQDSIQQTDSIDKVAVTDLQEYVVKAENAFIKEGVVTIIPTSKEKNAAFDGNELLRFLQIPSLVYDYDEKKIKHLSGALAIYINGEPTTEVEIQNLKAIDVTRVEYMDFPSDPRYEHNPHVVNFVVRKYLYGGYTRLNSEESLNWFSNYTTLYSKLSIKNLSFDAYISYLGYNSEYETDNTIATYCLNDQNETPSFLKEESQLLSGKHKSNHVPISLRIKYSKPAFTISNTIGYSFTGTPEESSLYNTIYTGIYNSTTSSSIKRGSHSNDVSWSGDYRFFFSKNWFFQVSPTLSYSRLNTRKLTNSGLDDLDEILYQNTENNYLASCRVHINKRFNNNHTLYLMTGLGHKWFDIKYHGTTDSESNEKLLFLNCILGYSYRFGPLSLGISGGYIYNHSSSGINKREESSPFIGINVYYSPTPKHSFSLSANYNNQNPHASEIVADIIQVNNFLYVTGDPNANGTKIINSQFSWTWIPTNMIRFGVSGFYKGKYDIIVPLYTTYAEGTALLRKAVNNGNQHTGDIYINFGLNNIANCISFTIGPSLYINNETGIYKNTLANFNYRASVDFLLKNGFSLFAAFYGPRKLYKTGEIIESSFSYNLGGRWSWKGLKVSLDLHNIFGGQDWSVKKSFNSEYYSTSNTNASKYNRYSVKLSLSYTFSYGKKQVEYRDEIKAIQGVGSGAIF